MKDVIQRLFASLTLILGFCTCDTQVWPTYRLSQDFKEYVLFPLGSYWIYNKEDNLDRDSIYLFDRQIQVVKMRNFSSYSELLDQKMTSSYFKDTLEGFGRPEAYDTIICLYGEEFISKSLSKILQFYSGYPIGTAVDNNSGINTKFSEELDGYVVNGILFREVRVFENHGIFDSLQVRKVYYARGVGVIKKELFNGEVWNLQKYKVD